jgi:hypothetical protein
MITGKLDAGCDGVSPFANTSSRYRYVTICQSFLRHNRIARSVTSGRREQARDLFADALSVIDTDYCRRIHPATGQSGAIFPKPIQWPVSLSRKCACQALGGQVLARLIPSPARQLTKIPLELSLTQRGSTFHCDT